MSFQILLSATLLLVLLYAVTQARSSPPIFLFATAASLVGTYLVWAPDDANTIAHALGIGRGADLLLYCWVVITFVLLLSVHIKLRRQFETMTLLAREIALLDAARHDDAQDAVATAISGSGGANPASDGSSTVAVS